MECAGQADQSSLGPAEGNKEGVWQPVMPCGALLPHLPELLDSPLHSDQGFDLALTIDTVFGAIIDGTQVRFPVLDCA